MEGVTNPANYAPVVVPRKFTHVGPLTAGQDLTTAGFGYQGNATVTGHLYIDTNGNGTQNGGEPNLADDDGSGDTPFPGVVICLLDAAGASIMDGLGAAITTTTTAANGSYGFGPEWFLGRSNNATTAWGTPYLTDESCGNSAPLEWSIADLESTGTPVYGKQGDILGAGTYTTTGTYTLQTFSVVPEPAAMLLVTARAALLLRRRRTPSW